MSGDNIRGHFLGVDHVALANIVMQFTDTLSFLFLEKVAEEHQLFNAFFVSCCDKNCFVRQMLTPFTTVSNDDKWMLPVPKKDGNGAVKRF